MKKRIVSALTAQLMCALALAAGVGVLAVPSGEVFAQDNGVAVDQTNFPDDNFRTFVSDFIDKDGNGILSAEEINATDTIGITLSDVTDLTGIEYFTSLTTLVCSGNKLKELDVSKNTALSSLSCYNNELTSLDLSHNTALESLYCSGNYLTQLDLSSNTLLTELYCNDNDITSLDLSDNTALKSLSCQNNELTSLDLSANASIGMFDCSDQSAVAEIDGGAHTADLSAIVENWPGAEDVQVTGGKLATDGKTLTFEWPYAVVRYDYAVGYGTFVMNVTLTLFEKGAVGEVAIDEKNFPDELFRQYVSNTLDTDGNGVLSEREIVSVRSISLRNLPFAPFGTYIHDLTGIGYFIALENLNCADQELTALNLSSNTALKSLSCEGNELTALDVSSNAALNFLSCDYNKLTTLDLSSNNFLRELNCSYNQLTELILPEGDALEYLSCEGNALTALDVSSNTALKTLYCTMNGLSELDLSGNSALEFLSADRQQMSKNLKGTNGEYKVDLSEYVHDMSRISNLIITHSSLGEDGKTIVFDDSGSVLVSYDYDTGYYGEVMSVMLIFHPCIAVAVEGGTISGTQESEVLAGKNDAVVITATVPEGKVFKGWSKDGGQTVISSKLTYTYYATEDVTFTAVFEDVAATPDPDDTTDPDDTPDPDVTKPEVDTPPEEPSGLPVGAVAGIAVGAVIAVLAVAYITGAVLFGKKVIKGTFFEKIYPFIK